MCGREVRGVSRTGALRIYAWRQVAAISLPLRFCMRPELKLIVRSTGMTVCIGSPYSICDLAKHAKFYPA
jgi:hypothetical protein